MLWSFVVVDRHCPLHPVSMMTLHMHCHQTWDTFRIILSDFKQSNTECVAATCCLDLDMDTV